MARKIGEMELTKTHLKRDVITVEGEQLFVHSIVVEAANTRSNISQVLNALIPKNGPIFERATYSEDLHECYALREQGGILIPYYAPAEETREALEFLFQPKSRYIIAHEIGHLWEDEAPSLEREKSTRILVYLMQRAHEEQLAMREVSIRTRTHIQNVLVDLVPLTLKSEEQAHNYALKTIQELRTKGLDLEPGISNAELVDFANSMIHSYERTYKKIKHRYAV